VSSAEALRTAAVAEGDELALFHRTLAEFCRAEVPLPRAFQLLQGDLRRGRFREAVAALAAEVEEGVPLGEAYARRKGAFPPLYRALVEAGMVSGDLPGVLEEIARHAARRAELRGRLRRALAYPVVAAFFVIAVGGAVLLFAAPTLWRLAAEMALPSPMPYAAGALGLLGLLLVTALLFGWVRRVRGAPGFRLPVVGRVRLHAARASLASTLALLLRRNVPLATALALATEACDDRRVASRLRLASEGAAAGAKLSEVLRDAGTFDPTLLWLVEAAEGTRDLPRALDDVGTVCARRFERGVDRLSVLVTPLAELVIGAAVFAFAYSFLAPLFEWAEGIFRL
jgi:type II secretory pathway component PulF